MKLEIYSLHKIQRVKFSTIGILPSPCPTTPAPKKIDVMLPITYIFSTAVGNIYTQTEWWRTPQDYIHELIIWILKPLVVSRIQQWIDYWNIEPTSRSKNTANGFYVQKNQFNIDFEMTIEFNIQIIKSLLHSWND